MSDQDSIFFVEYKSSREDNCKISGTRNGLAFLAKQLTEAVDQLPVQIESTQIVYLRGVQFGKITGKEVYFSFQCEPNLDDFRTQAASFYDRDRKLELLGQLLIVFVLGLIMVGLRTIIHWLLGITL